MPEKQTLTQFGQTIKAKHPEYSDMSDDDVANKVLAKYPQYRDMVATSQPGVVAGIQQSFDENTRINPNDTLMQRGLKDVVGTIGAPFVHPLNTAAGLIPKDFATQVTEARQQPKPTLAQGLVDAAGQAFGGLALGEAGGAALRTAAPVVTNVARNAGAATVDAASAMKDRIYPTPKSVPEPTMAARKLGKALVVPTQAMPNFVKAASEEAGTIKAYAQSQGIPINSTLDLANAAEGAAREVQGHFDNVILKPNEGKVISVPTDYRGAKLNVEGSRATLGEINNRINGINQDLNSAYRKATQGQTNAALVSDADLIAEKRKLTSLLHDNLADATGLEPEDIAAIRQKAGKLRTIADEVNLSANTNTTAAGKQSMGRSDIPTGTKMGLVERGIQTLRGGPEIIGNRAVKSAMRDISPTELVLPNQRTNPIANPVQSQVAPASINGTPFISVADRLDQLLERAKAQRPVRKSQ